LHRPRCRRRSLRRSPQRPSPSSRASFLWPTRLSPVIHSLSRTRLASDLRLRRG
jgi:hypothetical protein